MPAALAAEQRRLQAQLALPVVQPLQAGSEGHGRMDALIPHMRRLLDQNAAGSASVRRLRVNVGSTAG